MIGQKRISSNLKWLSTCGILTILSLFFFTASAQITSVNTIQGLSFGALSQGSYGGTVIINNSGFRSATGSVIPINSGAPHFQAIFEIEAPKGTIISILNGPDAILTGSKGGTMVLHLGNSNPGVPFVSEMDSPGRTQVNIGATLTLGSTSANPAGNYSGTFYITFNNE